VEVEVGVEWNHPTPGVKVKVKAALQTGLGHLGSEVEGEPV
jgi:hypothetical protein